MAGQVDTAATPVSPSARGIVVSATVPHASEAISFALVAEVLWHITKRGNQRLVAAFLAGYATHVLD